ncbi:ribonuclease P protein component [Candidatus Shikimatogenerans silvanidophilus]|uniref:ribonuclease P protein component n=1 Tax=Candidatus Shikimatogenerans silvanidophilus TaxID=2782547 RepID=UPI001BAA92D6|nr:ribonuclease P protein component [Candidatus Shikimatogenerans silvanidophilus]
MNYKKYIRFKKIYFIKKKSIKNKYAIITNLFLFFKKKENKFYLIIPKKNIKKSYLRNKIKRMIKNSFFIKKKYKKNFFLKNLVLLIIYKMKKIVIYKKIDKDIEKILEYIYYIYFFNK